MNNSELIEKAKQLVENEDFTNLQVTIANLKREFRRPRDEASLYEKEQEAEFDKYINILTDKQTSVLSEVIDKKNAIVQRAQKLINETNFKKGSKEMEELFQQWKSAGRTTREKDDELWEQFKQAKDTFYENRKNYFDGIKQNQLENLEKKKELIQKASEIAKQENIKNANNAMNELMDTWKTIKSAGKDVDEDLWKEFSSIRNAFNKKKNEFYTSIKEEYAKRTIEKKALIVEMENINFAAEFTQDEVDHIKQLRTKWKEIGNAGKENEDELYKQFNDAVNKYFEDKRYYNN